jgi:hypothetical protein
MTTRSVNSRFHSVIVRLLQILIVGCLIVLISSPVLAGSSNTIPQYGFLGSVTANAYIKSLQIPESTNGDCGIKSYTSPATNINVIGWTWWQCDRLRSDGTIVSSQNQGASVGYGTSSHQAGFTWTNAFSGGTTKLKAHGVHDFNHTGSSPSPWRPYNVNVYP